MRKAEGIQWDKLPLFADDLAIGSAVLGRERAKEWAGIASLYEGRGMPKIDEIHGGRYVPAVKAFYDRIYGLDAPTLVPSAPDGIERPEAWKKSKRRV